MTAMTSREALQRWGLRQLEIADPPDGSGFAKFSDVQVAADDVSVEFDTDYEPYMRYEFPVISIHAFTRDSDQQSHCFSTTQSLLGIDLGEFVDDLFQIAKERV